MDFSDLARRGFPTVVFGALLSVLSSTAVRGESADRGSAIVGRSIEFHGGQVFTASQSRLQLCSKSGCYEVTSRIDAGDYEIEVAGQARGHHRRVKITNAAVFHWQDGAAVEVPAESAQRLRDWVMGRAYFVYLPFRLQDESVVVRDLGSEVWKDRSLRKVKISFIRGSSSAADDQFLFWFDPESARLEQFAYSFSGNPGGLRFRRAFNYRRVGGILFYDQENWGLDGEGLTVDQIGPEEVAAWSRVSTVTVDGIEVTPLEP